jgi:glycine dehydrogenase subunit 1
MSYIPNTEADLNAMVEEIGVNSPEDLFSHIPEDIKLKRKLRLPDPLSEMELLTHLEELSSLNSNLHDCISFLGAGAYNHFIPAVVGHLAGRSEFYTSYTPYQPEISQGTLQAIFEYQSYMCMLTGMEVSNASMYDGASSAAEAVLMALRITRKNRILISGTVHPEYRQVIKTYTNIDSTEIVEIPYNDKGVTDPEKLSKALEEADAACVVIQSPNFFGIIEELDIYETIIRKNRALFIAAFSEPLAFGLLKPPGDFNADIVCGEGQSLGIPPGFGGPYLGILTVKNRHLRNMPGRIVGKTVDIHGNSSYVLTLTAREQHIRREKSRSNICTNESLCALTAAIYLSCLGKSGVKKIAQLNHSRSEYAKKQLLGIDGVKLMFESPTFNEFVLQTVRDPARIVDELSRKNIYAGVPLKRYYPKLENCLLVTVTEMNSTESIDQLCKSIKEL